MNFAQEFGMDYGTFQMMQEAVSAPKDGSSLD